jgi:hypothetical protein
VQAYAPTEGDSVFQKDAFYHALSDALNSISQSHCTIMLGDFNATVEFKLPGIDYSCVGQFGMGLINDNGERLVDICSTYQLRLTNTFFPSSA